MDIYDMLIIGGGPGGYTAALYAARAGLKVLVLEKQYAGGQMTQTHQIDNYPGFPHGIDGFTLALNMQQQAHRFGAETRFAQVLSARLSADPKQLSTDQGDFYGRTVVIATGSDPRPLELNSQSPFSGSGVHYCAACDGNFYRDKIVAVVGGGNTAAEDALLLSRIAKKVILIHRRSSLRADQIYQRALLQAPNVEIRWNSAVSQLVGQQELSGLHLKDLVSGKEQALSCNGIFVSIGRDPATGFLNGQLPLDSGGYIITDQRTATALPGVFAVGDVRSKSLRQIVTAVADGAMAVHRAEQFLHADA